MSGMLNRRPIFVNGFTRGGTTLVMNLLLSHPGVCAPAGETHQVFRGFGRTDSPWRIVRKWVFNELPLFPFIGPRAWSPRGLGPRAALSPRGMRHVDRVLFGEKLRARHPRLNLYRSEGEEYGDDEIAKARLVSKNVDGIVSLCDWFAEMYPDATFICVLRHGLAVCEGHVRRGWHAYSYGTVYDGLVSRMLADAERMSNCHLVRFEDLLSAPDDFVARLYDLCGLDLSEVAQFRMERMPTVQKDGQWKMRFDDVAENSIRWFPRRELREHIEPDVDRNQIALLSDEQRDGFLETASDVMERVGYL